MLSSDNVAEGTPRCRSGVCAGGPSSFRGKGRHVNAAVNAGGRLRLSRGYRQGSSRETARRGLSRGPCLERARTSMGGG